MKRKIYISVGVIELTYTFEAGVGYTGILFGPSCIYEMGVVCICVWAGRRWMVRIWYCAGAGEGGVLCIISEAAVLCCDVCYNG